MPLQSFSNSLLPPRPAQPKKRAVDGGFMFVNRDRAILRGQDHIATAVSKTMAKRIANALNVYRTNKEGV